MSRRSKAAEAPDAPVKAPGGASGAAPPRPAVTIALLMVVPAVVLLLDGNLSVQSVVLRFAGALALTWRAASLIGSTVRSARRSIAHARAEAAAEEARQKREARKAAKEAKAAAAAAGQEPAAVGTDLTDAETAGPAAS